MVDQLSSPEKSRFFTKAKLLKWGPLVILIGILVLTGVWVGAWFVGTIRSQSEALLKTQQAAMLSARHEEQEGMSAVLSKIREEQIDAKKRDVDLAEKLNNLDAAIHAEFNQQIMQIHNEIEALKNKRTSGKVKTAGGIKAQGTSKTRN